MVRSFNALEGIFNILVRAGSKKSSNTPSFAGQDGVCRQVCLPQVYSYEMVGTNSRLMQEDNLSQFTGFCLSSGLPMQLRTGEELEGGATILRRGQMSMHKTNLKMLLLMLLLELHLCYMVEEDKRHLIIFLSYIQM